MSDSFDALPNPVHTPVSSLDFKSLLSDYKQPMVDPTRPVSIPTPPTQPEQRVYKTGKKQGQPRPVKQAQPPQVSNPVPSAPPLQQGVPITNTLVSGTIFLIVIDVVFPFIITFASNMISKIKIDASKLKLTDRQKSDMEPLANEVIKYLNLTANPVLMFLVGMFGCYAMNYQLHVLEIKHKQALKKL